MTASPVPILVIDDNAAKRLALKAALAPLGHTIVEAESGLEGLRCLMAQDFAVILLDVRMPIMDGFETANLIRQRQQSEMTPIIFITAHGSRDVIDTDRWAEGAVDFMFAPVPPAELRAKVSVFAKTFIRARELATQAREVQASANQLRLLTDAAPIGIFQTDVANRYVYTNPRWTEITGIQPEEAVGREWDAIIGPGERAGLYGELPDGEVYRAELCHRFEIRQPGSAARVVLMTSKSIPDSAGGTAGWVGTLADITAEAGVEAAMADARDKATEASRLKSDFLANMSHEIRTPLNGVIGMADLLLEGDLDARQRDYAQTMRNSGEALLTIIGDILDFSKVEAGKLEIEDIEFDLPTIVDDVVDLLVGPAHAKGLELVAAIENSVPAVVSGDPGRVRQVLINLIGNAIKFTQTGRISLRVTEGEASSADAEEADSPQAACARLNCKTRCTATVIRFEVSDTGDGIAPEKLAMIFQPFVQADTSTSRKYGGTGLGLAISSQLVALMGGDCGVSSRPGEGSDFWFTIRVHPVAGQTSHVRVPPQALGRDDLDAAPTPTPTNGHTTIPTRAPGPGPSGLILLAEDNLVNQQVATAMLEHLGFQVDVVADGAEAVKATTLSAYQAILMDCQMPVQDGYEATREIRRLQGVSNRTPIIAVTASAMKSDQQRCLAAGMDDYLPKPLSLTALGAVLERWAPDARAPDAQAPTLDPEILARLERLGTDAGEDLLGQLVTLFLSEAETTLAALGQALANSDAAALVRLAHTLRGAAANLGANELARLCAELESAPAAAGPEELEAIAAELERVRSALVSPVGAA